MKRNRFSLRRQHFKRRSRVTEAEVEHWKQQMAHLFETADHDYILNCDETAWKLYPNNILTWWEIGADDVSIKVDGDEKGMITVLATISASKNKWPLFFVAKGKTVRVESSQIGEVGSNWRAHSETGWMRGELFVDYLHHLRSQVSNAAQTIHLICDVHASHRTPDVKQAARELNIVLLYIPAGATDRLQPLDRCIFGALKSEARRLFRERISANAELKRSKRDAVEDMLVAWARLSDETLQAAWDVYESQEEWAEQL
jgi:hypothetical protein